MLLCNYNQHKSVLGFFSVAQQLKSGLGRLAEVSRPHRDTHLVELPWPIPVTFRSKAWAFSRSLAGIVGSNPARGMDVSLLVVFVCCQAEVSPTGPSLVQRSPTERRVSECDLETSKRKRLRPDLSCCTRGKEKSTPLDEWSARRRGRYLHKTQQTQGTNIHVLSGIRSQ
jgi:hypothetical protein